MLDNKVLISHECPLCLLTQSYYWNNYDYCLVHLLEKYPAYYNFFQKSIENKRHVILDNSIFWYYYCYHFYY